jgi:23S rRNA A2030 N6-methylase RlmJ
MSSGVELTKHRSSFCSELHPKDLNRLRNVLRRMFKVRTKRHDISDWELDRWIESIGPKVREKTIQQAVDRKLVD